MFLVSWGQISQSWIYGFTTNERVRSRQRKLASALRYLGNGDSGTGWEIRCMYSLIRSRLRLSIGTESGDLEWPWNAQWPLFCVISPKATAFRSN